MVMIFLQKYLEMIVTSIIGTFGFCLLFHVKKNKLIYACAGGALSIIVYFVCVEIGLSLLMQNMIPAAVATLYAEIIARVVKAPATVFLIPGVIPLTPGGKLYYTMRAIIDGNESEVDGLGNETVVIALGIAVGIVLVSLVFYQISHRYVRFQIRFGETMK